MLSRKDFLQNSLLAATGFVASGFQFSSENQVLLPLNIPEIPSDKLAEDEGFWKEVRSQFSIGNEMIYFNYGNVSPQPKTVQAYWTELRDFANEGPSINLRQRMDEQRELLRSRMAKWLNISKEELAFNRNATEGLSNIIFGLPLEKGDEVIVSQYDYPYVLNAWKQREKRDGIALKWADFELPSPHKKTIINAYKNQITSQTKLMHITQVINWNGEVLPVKDLVELAHEHTIETLVDGAHAPGNLTLDLADLKSDYYAASLHKWMFAPFGTGFLVVAKEKISKIWPLMAAYESISNDIKKFETLGTRDFTAEIAINAALDFEEKITTEMKSNRLHYLRKLTMELLSKNSAIQFFTSEKREASNGMFCIGLKGQDASEIYAELMKKKIQTSAVKVGKINGVRVSPAIFTSLDEIHLLVDSINDLTARK